MKIPATIDQHYVVRLNPVLDRNIQEQLTKLRNEGVDLVIVALPEKNTPFYSKFILTIFCSIARRLRFLHLDEVKRVADIVLGLMTQCVIRKNIEKSAFATVQNIVLKMNAKMKGINSETEATAL